MEKYLDENVYMVYAFEKNGKSDPIEISQIGIAQNSIMKCPVLAADAPMAIELFTEKYPDLMIAGIVNLADLKKEIIALEEFKTAS